MWYGLDPCLEQWDTEKTRTEALHLADLFTFRATITVICVIIAELGAPISEGHILEYVNFEVGYG